MNKLHKWKTLKIIGWCGNQYVEFIIYFHTIQLSNEQEQPQRIYQKMLLIYASRLILIFLKMSQAELLNDTESLYKYLFESYRKELRPVLNQTDVVNVRITLSILTINDFDEVSGTITLTVMFNSLWQEERFVWDPKEYGGLKSLTVPQESVWLPGNGINDRSRRDSTHIYERQFQSSRWKHWSDVLVAHRNDQKRMRSRHNILSVRHSTVLHCLVTIWISDKRNKLRIHEKNDFIQTFYGKRYVAGSKFKRQHRVITNGSGTQLHARRSCHICQLHTHNQAEAAVHYGERSDADGPTRSH